MHPKPHIHVKSPLSGNIRTRLRMYQVSNLGAIYARGLLLAAVTVLGLGTLCLLFVLLSSQRVHYFQKFRTILISDKI